MDDGYDFGEAYIYTTGRTNGRTIWEYNRHLKRSKERR
jgi:hypothetical protein